ncbi:MAG TPA: hypothetical protein ENJ37_07180 [Deltaproteobacteria bacterium]|nr:hypothetical protein [Deltaproteobacteria bacterium]
MKRFIVPGCVLVFALVFFVSDRAAADIKLPSDSAYRTVKKDSPQYRDIVSLFATAIESAKQKDLDSVLSLYATKYLNSGYSKADVRRQWEQIFRHFDQLDMDHRIYEIEVSGDYARMKCGGLLLGEPAVPSADEGTVGVIDSWKFATHQLVRENGEWKILGNQVPYDSGEEHHPLF